MKRLKTIFQWIKRNAHRPLLGVFLVTLFVSLIFAEAFTEKLKNTPLPDSSLVKIRGRIRDLQYGEGDMIKYVVIGEWKCYVNNISMADAFIIGDIVLIKGNETPIAPPENPGEFDSFKYELSKGIRHIVFTESAEVLKPSKFNIVSYFKILNHNMSEALIKKAPVSGSTVSTILLGDKRNLPENRKDLFSYVSLSFFLVISGLHVSFLSALLLKLLKSITGSCKVSLIMTVVLIILYGLLTGFTVSVKRAVIMYLIRALAEFLDKNYDTMSALSFAGILELISNPFSVYSISFIYSYSAVFIIAFFYSYVQPDIPKEYFRNRLFLLLRLPLFMMLFMPAVSLLMSSEFSFAGMLINIILSFITMPLLILGIVLLIFSNLNLTGLTLYFDFIEGLLIKLIDAMCLTGSKLSILRTTGMPGVINIILYSVTAFMAVLMLKKRFLRLSLLIMAVSLNLLTHRFFMGPVITFLSVGQGDSCVIQTGKRSALIIDTGSTSKKKPGEYILIPYLKYRGIDTIEKVFLSHGDMDHVGGVLELIGKDYSGIDIKEIIFPDVGFNEAFNDISVVSKEKGIGIRKIHRGDSLHNNTFNIECLWPEKSKIETCNDNSMVLLVNITKNTKVLFTGDIGAEAEAGLKLSYINGIDILKVAHHGSKYSTSEEFLERIKPEIAVISCGVNNYGHPAKETLQRLQGFTEDIFITKDKGALVFHINDQRFFTGTRKLGTTSEAGDV